LNDAGIDPAASPGSIAFRKMEATAGTRWKLRIRLGSTVTYPPPPAQAIMFYTKATSLSKELDATPFRERADLARDKLGLVVRKKGDRLVEMSFDSDIVEKRTDRGRPTAVDAGGYPRFACELSSSDAGRGWGVTVDLSSIPVSLAPGMPERICGAFPPDIGSAVEVELRFLGEVKASRGDDVSGRFDKEFGDALEGIVGVSDPSFNLRVRLVGLLS
jgi:hypothetical protein